MHKQIGGGGRGALTVAAVWLMLATGQGGCGSSSPGGGSGGAGGGSGGSGGQSGGTGGASPSDGGGQCGTCFVHGTWRIDNLSPCFVATAAGDAGASTLATVLSTQVMAGTSQCPADLTMKPTQAWSTDTLTTDCPGHYHLCITLKAGSAKAPAADDCTMIQVCADGDYATANQAQTWAPLAGWMIDPSNLACAQKFQDHGGYAQLTATGNATGCGAITKTLAVIGYCPLSCQTNPSGPDCASCMSGGSGTF